MLADHVRRTPAGAGSSKSLAKTMDLLCDCISTVCNATKKVQDRPCERALATKLGLRNAVSFMYTYWQRRIIAG